MENENIAPAKNSNEKTFSVITHLIPLAGYVLPGIGLILGPLIWWVLMRDKYPAVDLHGKEVLNFSISYFIHFLISALLCFIIIGIPIFFGLTIAFFVFIIIGTVKASNGELYHYPLTFRFIK